MNEVFDLPIEAEIQVDRSNLHLLTIQLIRVLQLSAEGYQVQQIAEIMNRARQTITKNRQRIEFIFGVDRFEKAVIIAWYLGIIK